MNGNQKFVKLLDYRNNRGNNIYDALKTAKELLSDREWVEAPSGGGGDEDKAITRLESECFPDICGAVSLPQLLEVLQAFPQEKEWTRHKYNLKAMWAELRSKQKTTKARTPVERTVRGLVTTTAFTELPPAQQRNEFERAKQMVERDSDKIARLEEENKELREENLRLIKENQLLRKNVSRILAAADRMTA